MQESENRPGTLNYISTGTPGLDEVISGFRRGSMFLIEGEAGAGKTMLALAFAAKGATGGESALYVTLSETKPELEEIARIHGLDISNVQIMEGSGETKYTLFHPSEVELADAIAKLKSEIDKAKPALLVIDSLAEMRLMTESSLRYRRELMGLKRFLNPLNCTALILDETERADAKSEYRSRSLVDGLISLEHIAPDYGGERRRLRVVKYRGHAYAGGYHDFVIRQGGLQVFPRLVAAEHRTRRELRHMPSGVAELDAMLGGGVSRGASTLLLGQAGTGKSSVGLLFVTNAAEYGENAVIYAFDERPEMILARATGMGMNLKEHVEAGRVCIRQVDPVELSPGQFAHAVREEVEVRHVTIVMIDSINGYVHAMPDEHFLVAQLHELLTYLGQQEVSSFLVMGQAGMMGEGETPVSTSYLTDNIILHRFFEADGSVHRSLAVVKKRSGKHEQTIREVSFGPDGVHISEPLRGFQGVLLGVPHFTGAPAS